MNSTADLILASNSPRRQQLLREAGFDFIVRTLEIEESFHPRITANEVAKYLSEKKNKVYREKNWDEVIITADTTVVLGDEVINKPAHREEAYDMIRSLSGTFHEVITGVTISSLEHSVTFSDTTKVYFRVLKDDEIYHYIDHYQPYDKAGAYGIQEWIGMVGIEKIKGSYFNVVGLPTHKVYDVLVNDFSIYPK